jgi:hypothetical protein
VRLPKGVFAPYTSIQTNVLFFTKGRPTKEIWFYEHPYPPGVQVVLQDQAHAGRGVRRREGLVDSVDAISHDPTALLHEIAGLDAEIATLKAQLKATLAGALERA